MSDERMTDGRLECLKETVDALKDLDALGKLAVFNLKDAVNEALRARAAETHERERRVAAEAEVARLTAQVQLMHDNGLGASWVENSAANQRAESAEADVQRLTRECEALRELEADVRNSYVERHTDIHDSLQQLDALRAANAASEAKGAGDD